MSEQLALKRQQLQQQEQVPYRDRRSAPCARCRSPRRSADPEGLQRALQAPPPAKHALQHCSRRWAEECQVQQTPQALNVHALLILLLTTTTTTTTALNVALSPLLICVTMCGNPLTIQSSLLLDLITTLALRTAPPTLLSCAGTCSSSPWGLAVCHYLSRSRRAQQARQSPERGNAAANAPRPPQNHPHPHTLLGPTVSPGALHASALRAASCAAGAAWRNVPGAALSLPTAPGGGGEGGDGV
eukprot:444452-Pelagomonas_calceolata.AAC.4